MNFRYDICFLILNYNTSEELVKFIASIKKFCGDCTYLIVVVDNGSEKKELERLKILQQTEKFILLVNHENLGFAKGNNIGFRYIRSNIECRYIVMANSDVELIENSLCNKLDAAYDRYKFAVLGPDIMKSHDNPMPDGLSDRTQVLCEIKRIKHIRRIMKVPGLNILYLVVNKLRNKLLSKRAETGEMKENCQLHGSFLVFSDQYILDGLCDETFLYGEEAILAKDCRDHGLKILYYPDIKILHNESVATKKVMNKLIARKLFYLNNYIDSLYVLLRKYKQ